MPLQMPRYIQAAKIDDPVVRYAWDDWRDLAALQKIDAALRERLDRVSQRAVLAFMCGTAEWLVQRFAGLLDDPAPWVFLDAAWAMTVNVHYGEPGGAGSWEKYQLKGWDGPVKRPVAKGLLRLEIGIHLLGLDGTDPVGRAGLLETLTTYVLTDPTPYHEWCDIVLARFEALYPLDENDYLGDVVPREAIDPTQDFRVEDTERLINQFLSTLDYRTNPFLSSPEGMLDSGHEERLGFVGTPYSFSIEEDRLQRTESDEDEGDEEGGEDGGEE